MKLTESLKTMDKDTGLKNLYDEYKLSCENDNIENAGGLSFVWGFGKADSKVVLIGEAPGKDEVKFGRPFVGKAGKILDEFLEKTGIERSELFITNTIKYRLARRQKGSEDDSRLANRPAKKQEIEKGSEFLKKELEIIEPAFVITLGRVPMEAVRLAFDIPELKNGIGFCHGKNYIVDGKLQIIPLYHPASIIYNSSLASVYGDDLNKVKKLILG